MPSAATRAGSPSNPTYRDVCNHTTGHAEVVQVTFDPSVVTFDQLLEVFWAMHDPTQVNRQGPDVGDQYRSAIYTTTPEQLRAAEASKDRGARAVRLDPSPPRSATRRSSSPLRTTTSATTRATGTSRTATCSRWACSASRDCCRPRRDAGASRARRGR